MKLIYEKLIDFKDARIDLVSFRLTKMSAKESGQSVHKIKREYEHQKMFLRPQQNYSIEGSV